MNDLGENLIGCKSKKPLLNFVDYCLAHPDERFWQALRNWSEADFILAVGLQGHTLYKAEDEVKIRYHDTFYWKGKQKK
jgi:hypothetical protein